MELFKKYEDYKGLFYSYFIFRGNGEKEPYNLSGTFIPAAQVRFSKGVSTLADIGDGTINMAEYLQYLYACGLNGEDVQQEIENTLLSLKRLSKGCYEYFTKNNPNIYFNEEAGFFLRDDIKDDDADNFHSARIRSGFSSGIQRIEEDPCFSPFVSQDQIWNLLPILSVLGNNDICNGFTATVIYADILNYVIKNNHTIYNPYYSALKHNWTYLNLDTPYNDRIRERNAKLKYDIKVKRGANNWYYAFGFRKSFDEVSMIKCNQFKTFLYSLIYYPLIFCADKIYFPFMEKVFGMAPKDNSYHCLGVSSKKWYTGRKRFLKHLIKGYKDKGRYTNVMFLEAIRQGKLKDIPITYVVDYLNNYPDPVEDGNMSSPLQFMTVYQYYQYYINN